MTFGELYRHFVSKYGTSRRTFRAYLEDLMSAGEITRKSVVIIGVSSKDGTVVGKEEDIIFELVNNQQNGQIDARRRRKKGKNDRA